MREREREKERMAPGWLLLEAAAAEKVSHSVRHHILSNRAHTPRQTQPPAHKHCTVTIKRQQPMAVVLRKTKEAARAREESNSVQGDGQQKEQQPAAKDHQSHNKAKKSAAAGAAANVQSSEFWEKGGSDDHKETKTNKQTRQSKWQKNSSSSSRHFLIPISLAAAAVTRAYQSINTSKESPTTESTPPTRHIIIEVHRQTDRRKKLQTEW